MSTKPLLCTLLHQNVFENNEEKRQPQGWEWKGQTIGGISHSIYLCAFKISQLKLLTVGMNGVKIITKIYFQIFFILITILKLEASCGKTKKIFLFYLLFKTFYFDLVLFWFENSLFCHLKNNSYSKLSCWSTWKWSRVIRLLLNKHLLFAIKIFKIIFIKEV